MTYTIHGDEPDDDLELVGGCDQFVYRCGKTPDDEAHKVTFTFKEVNR